MKFIVEQIEACVPVTELLGELLSKGFIIEKSKIGDYHFRELHFLLKTSINNIYTGDININKIARHGPSTFYCQCHWSIIELNMY